MTRELPMLINRTSGEYGRSVRDVRYRASIIYCNGTSRVRERLDEGIYIQTSLGRMCRTSM